MAVLMTVHNRRETTLDCLRLLDGQTGRGSDFDLEVFLVDDGSTDGTAEALAEEFPSVTVIPGDGDYFWARGMAVADTAAARTQPYAYLWLNDDTRLYEDAVARLMAVVRAHPGAIAVGATRASDVEEITYGGRRRLGSHPLRLGPLLTPRTMLECDTFEGNAVLVPAAVREVVGSIDGDYPHAYADTDYGLRARSQGIRILQIPGFVGVCDVGPRLRQRMSLPRAWADLNSPKGLPWRAQMKFLRRHGDWRWPWWLAAGQVSQLSQRLGWTR